MSFFSPQTLPPEIILYITDRLTSLRDLSALASTNHDFDAVLSPVLYRHGMRLDPELFLRMCGQGGSRTGTVARLLKAGADPSIQHLSANSLGFTGLVRSRKLDTPYHFDSSLGSQDFRQQYRNRRQGDPDIEQQGWELGAREDAICVRSATQAQVCQAITEARRDRNKWHVSWSAIHAAAVRGNIGVLKLLLAHQHDLVNSLAPGYGKVDEFEQLTRLGRESKYMDEGQIAMLFETRPQIKSWSLHTPLRAALCSRQEDAARLLIDHGADLEFTDPQNQGRYQHALHVAARYGCTEIIKHLCSQPHLVDVNITDAGGSTPLCQAIVSPIRNIDTITTLLTYGADVNFQLPQSHGLTHLHLACWQRDWHRVLQLLRAGANVHAIWKPDPATFPEYYWSRGPWRAIDLVCMENFNEPPDGVDPSQRTDVVYCLVKDYGADTGACPGAEHTALSIAATNPADAQKFEVGRMELLTALRDAGVFFHTETSLIGKVLRPPRSLHVRSGLFDTINDDLEWSTIYLFTWLARHGARFDVDEVKECLFETLMNLLTYAIKENRDAYLTRDLVEMFTMLVKRGGLDPDITSEKHEFAKDGPCSLYRAVLKVGDLGVHKAMSQAMADLGAKPPGLLVALRDFKNLVPAIADWEAEEMEWTEAREMAERKRYDAIEEEAAQQVKSGAQDLVGRHAEVAGRGSMLNAVTDVSEGDDIETDGNEHQSAEEHGDHDEYAENNRYGNATSREIDPGFGGAMYDESDASSDHSSQLQQPRHISHYERVQRKQLDDRLNDLETLFCRTLDHVFKNPANLEIPTSTEIAMGLFGSGEGSHPHERANIGTKSKVEHDQELAVRFLEMFLKEDYAKGTAGDFRSYANLAGFIETLRMLDYDRTLHRA